MFGTRQPATGTPDKTGHIFANPCVNHKRCSRQPIPGSTQQNPTKPNKTQHIPTKPYKLAQICTPKYGPSTREKHPNPNKTQLNPTHLRLVTKNSMTGQPRLPGYLKDVMRQMSWKLFVLSMKWSVLSWLGMALAIILIVGGLALRSPTALRVILSKRRVQLLDP
jgi:hypothetical protein